MESKVVAYFGVKGYFKGVYANFDRNVAFKIIIN